MGNGITAIAALVPYFLARMASETVRLLEMVLDPPISKSFRFS